MTGPHHDLDGGAGTCCHCGKAIARHLNYCDWDCHVAAAKAAGGSVHTPNGLPIRCIKGDNTMLEHEHGDHPDYKFPVEVEWIGPDDDDGFTASDGERLPAELIDGMKHETHALIYSDGSVAITMDECCYALWYVHGGRCGGGSLWKNTKNWQLSAASCAAIQSRFPIEGYAQLATHDFGLRGETVPSPPPPAGDDPSSAVPPAAEEVPASHAALIEERLAELDAGAVQLEDSATVHERLASVAADGLSDQK